jgi:hypothetical protein
LHRSISTGDAQNRLVANCSQVVVQFGVMTQIALFSWRRRPLRPQINFLDEHDFGTDEQMFGAK